MSSNEKAEAKNGRIINPVLTFYQSLLNAYTDSQYHDYGLVISSAQNNGVLTTKYPSRNHFSSK